MHATSHLSSEQLDDLRQRLLDARAAAKALLSPGAADQEPVEGVGQTIGRLTRMDAIQVQAMASMNRYKLEIRLKQIEAALAQWDAGRYGICRSCKGPINIARLEALPEAPFCVACQEGFEASPPS